MGTPEFAVAPLKNLIDSGYEVVAVITNPDRPTGRKQVLTAPPVKVFAESVGIKVFQYEKIRKEGVDDLKTLAPDIGITCAFGQILSQEILDIPKIGVFNIHASLLPKYRGASPISEAILKGETETGVTVMKTDVGIDTGDILISDKIEIEKEDNLKTLSDKLSVLGAELIVKALKIIESGNYSLIKQDESLASYSKMTKKEDALISWNDTAENIVNKIRAFNPAPVAYTLYKGEPFKIYSAETIDTDGEKGKVFHYADGLAVASKRGSVVLKTVQKAGGKAMDIKDFLRGNNIPEGTEFGV